MTAYASHLSIGKSAWCKIRQGAVLLTFLSTLSGVAWGDDALPPPSDLEGAKSDILQLDRDLAQLENRLVLTERTTLLFGLSAKSKQKLSSISVKIDNKPTLTASFTADQVDSLHKGGMATLKDFNLPIGAHVLDVSLQDATSGKRVEQRFNFNKATARNIMALEWVERPAPNQPPIKLIEWNRHD